MTKLTINEMQVIWKLGLRLESMPHAELTILRDLLDKIVGLLDEVRSKEAKLRLAQKVLEETGDNSGVDRFSTELMNARKDYAKFISEFNIRWRHTEPLPRDDNGQLFPSTESLNEDRLKPL